VKTPRLRRHAPATRRMSTIIRDVLMVRNDGWPNFHVHAVADELPFQNSGGLGYWSDLRRSKRRCDGDPPPFFLPNVIEKLPLLHLTVKR